MLRATRTSRWQGTALLLPLHPRAPRAGISATSPAPTTASASARWAPTLRASRPGPKRGGARQNQQRRGFEAKEL